MFTKVTYLISDMVFELIVISVGVVSAAFSVAVNMLNKDSV